jgi:two-component system sensor histidine kinase PilS (NtrC family)
LLPKNYAFFIATIASVTLIVFTYSYYDSVDYITDTYIQHGIVATLLFSLVIILSRLSQKNITTQLRLDQQAIELKNLEQINQQVMDSLKSGVLIVNKQYQIKHTNHAAINYLKLKNSQKKLSLAFKQELKKWMNSHFSYSVVFQETLEHPKLRLTFEPFSNNWIMITLDKMSAINDELQQLKLSALGRLTASIAHEIRNPLSSINQATQLLEELSNTSESKKKLTNIILNNTNRMNLMVEKIMQLSKKQQFHPQNIDLRSFLNIFVYEFCIAENFQEDKISLVIENNVSNILFDPTHLNQILWNLCLNSIVHSGIKTTELALSIYCRYKHKRLEIVYDDNGKGIKKDRIESFFEPFYTTSSSSTGLGLYICKELCNLNQSELIYIESKTGSSFKIATSEILKEQK